LEVYEVNRAAIEMYERLGLKSLRRRMRQPLTPADGERR
jgi:ribosomal protein S18 acetylase RimI-like enzyme